MYFQFKVPVEEELAERMISVLDKYKDSFFVIELKSDPNKRSIEDPDPNVSSEIMDGRDSFLLYVRLSLVCVGSDSRDDAGCRVNYSFLAFPPLSLALCN